MATSNPIPLVRVLITLLVSTHEPPSKDASLGLGLRPRQCGIGLGFRV